MHTLDLFSGIGGFSLGLERTGGFKTVAFCEINPFCRAVLAKHWPAVPCYEDVRTLNGADVDGIDVICGGFPCQDISTAGKGAGITGERSGLWREYARLIGEIRPRYVIVENVAALLGRGLGTVLGDLAALGYDSEWDCIPASAVGAPHRRDRIWIVAYPARERCGEAREHCERSTQRAASGGQILGDADGAGLAEREAEPDWPEKPTRRLSWDISAVPGWWASEPVVGRVVDGFSGRVDRIRALGNAVVPQIPEMIGRAILAAEAA